MYEDTKFCIFPRKMITEPCDNILISQTQVIKMLGVFLDSNLSYKPHLSYLRSILSRHVGVLQRVQSFLHTEVMVPLYYRFFDSRLSCCYSIWGVAASSLITPMRRLQNIAVKAMFGPHQVYPSADLYNDTGIKNVFPGKKELCPPNL